MSGSNAALTDWRSLALCKNDARYSDLKLIPPGPGRLLLRKRLAAVCVHCPVFDECEQEVSAIPEHMRYGIWAGKVYRT